ncbi:hypothetical protein BFJ63_vAg6414 [Fusarium oxysporum f. sp. narcissi]|uniref:Uncharacterized protein n=1 Tax=Fusarium oxysporum f. sp. narcissi TaxID=451672 RepID=A0A4Q2VV79_FUSOX|nr:hypothetical protein BFJ63_vAg6414 [Fusarium oxysporum f. sp. narcissi]
MPIPAYHHPPPIPNYSNPELLSRPLLETPRVWSNLTPTPTPTPTPPSPSQSPLPPLCIGLLRDLHGPLPRLLSHELRNP